MYSKCARVSRDVTNLRPDALNLCNLQAKFMFNHNNEDYYNFKYTKHVMKLTTTVLANKNCASNNEQKAVLVII